MAKINKEEYEILKSLDSKWQWLARDSEYNSLNVFSVKPFKVHSQWDYMDVGYKHTELTKEENKMFQFIQWEDEEPYSIAELIDEYESEYHIENAKIVKLDASKLVARDASDYKHFYKRLGESEETEVKKDIEWLKREIHKELEDWHGVEGGIDGDGINEIMLLINQHEESEVKRLERKMKELESYNDELIRDNNQLRNELDNQEVLSEEWIEEHVDYADVRGGTQAFIHAEDLQNLLVPKQEQITEEQEEERPETVARVIFEYVEATQRFKEILGMKVEELEK